MKNQFSFALLLVAALSQSEASCGTFSPQANGKMLSLAAIAAAS